MSMLNKPSGAVEGAKTNDGKELTAQVEKLKSSQSDNPKLSYADDLKWQKSMSPPNKQSTCDSVCGQQSTMNSNLVPTANRLSSCAVGKGASQKFFTLDWKIQNFINWDSLLHADGLHCKSQLYHELQIVLYPRGQHNVSGCFSFFIKMRNTNLEVLISIFKVQPMEKMWFCSVATGTKTYILKKGPKYGDLMQNMAESTDILIRFQIRNFLHSLERVCITIWCKETSFVLQASELDIDSTGKVLRSIEWSLDNGTVEMMELLGVQHPHDTSKLSLVLVPTCLKKRVMVEVKIDSRGKILKHTFTNCNGWELTILKKEDISQTKPIFIFLKVIPHVTPKIDPRSDPPSDVQDDIAMAGASVSDPSTNPADLGDANQLASALDMDGNFIRSLEGREQANYAEGDTNRISPSSMENNLEDVFSVPNIKGFDYDRHAAELDHRKRGMIKYHNIMKCEILSQVTWKELVKLHSESVRLEFMDLAEKLLDTLSSKMADAVMLAKRLNDQLFLEEIHNFFLGNRQQLTAVLSTPQWTKLVNENPGLKTMFE